MDDNSCKVELLQGMLTQEEDNDICKRRANPVVSFCKLHTLILSIVEKFDRCNNVRYNDTPCFFMWGSQVENSSSMKPVAQWQRACLDEKMTGVQFFPSFQLFNLGSDRRRTRCVTVPHISVSMLLEYYCY